MLSIFRNILIPKISGSTGKGPILMGFQLASYLKRKAPKELPDSPALEASEAKLQTPQFGQLFHFITSAR